MGIKIEGIILNTMGLHKHSAEAHTYRDTQTHAAMNYTGPLFCVFYVCACVYKTIKIVPLLHVYLHFNFKMDWIAHSHTHIHTPRTHADTQAHKCAHTR